MSSKTKTVGQHLLISGKVQGVGFRRFLQKLALSYGYRGWVRNLQDGRVEAFIAGDIEQKEFFAALLAGPGGAALVENLEIRETSDMIGSGEFSILATGSRVCFSED